MSVAGRKRSTIGVGHDGKPKAGAFVPADHPAALLSHPHAVAKTHSGMQDVTNVQATLGRAPQPKRAHMTTPPINSAMVTRSRDTGTAHFGGDALSRADANPSNPLGGAPRGKNITAPQPSFGQRSRLTDSVGGDAPGANHARGVGKGVRNQLGAMIIQQALAVAGPDHPGNMGIGTLPDSNDD